MTRGAWDEALRLLEPEIPGAELRRLWVDQSPLSDSTTLRWRGLPEGRDMWPLDVRRLYVCSNPQQAMHRMLVTGIAVLAARWAVHQGFVR